LDLTTIRGKYTTKNFDIKDLNKNPFKQFESRIKGHLPVMGGMV
jgi:hypothetical protein